MAPAVILGPKSKEQLAQELAEAANTPENLERERVLGEAQGRAETQDREEMSGKDLDFDIASFVAYGKIKKENLLVIPGMYVDMQSLSQRDRIVADLLVKSKFGNLTATDNVYNSALESAILAMSVTRINNKSFPLPSMDQQSKDPKVYAQYFSDKVLLFDKILDSNEKLVQFLSVLYNQLENADVLKEFKEGVDVGKKSDAPSSQKSSGSSAEN